MPVVEMEVELGVWERKDVSHEIRRALLAISLPEQRFIKDDIVYIAHPLNFWCLVSNGLSFEHVEWTG